MPLATLNHAVGLSSNQYEDDLELTQILEEEKIRKMEVLKCVEVELRQATEMGSLEEAKKLLEIVRQEGFSGDDLKCLKVCTVMEV